jgi:hypothetical protein
MNGAVLGMPVRMVRRVQIGVPNEEERQGKHNDPGEQAQGEVESETPQTASAVDRLIC